MVAAIDLLNTLVHVKAGGSEKTVTLQSHTSGDLVPLWFHMKILHLLPNGWKGS